MRKTQEFKRIGGILIPWNPSEKVHRAQPIRETSDTICRTDEDGVHYICGKCGKKYSDELDAVLCCLEEGSAHHGRFVSED